MSRFQHRGGFARPENALKRADELQLVGQKLSALQQLHDVVTSKKHRTWSKTYEEIMFKLIDLCVEMKKRNHAKEALMQYRNMCQQVNINSLEEVIKYYLNKATEKAEEARQQAEVRAGQPAAGSGGSSSSSKTSNRNIVLQLGKHPLAQSHKHSQHVSKAVAAQHHACCPVESSVQLICTLSLRLACDSQHTVIQQESKQETTVQALATLEQWLQPFASSHIHGQHSSLQWQWSAMRLHLNAATRCTRMQAAALTQVCPC